MPRRRRRQPLSPPVLQGEASQLAAVVDPLELQGPAALRHAGEHQAVPLQVHLRLGRLHLEVGRDIIYWRRWGVRGLRGAGIGKRLKGESVSKASTLQPRRARAGTCTRAHLHTKQKKEKKNPADSEGTELFPFFSATADWELEGQQRSLPKTAHGISCNYKKKKTKRKERKSRSAPFFFYPSAFFFNRSFFLISVEMRW